MPLFVIFLTRLYPTATAFNFRNENQHIELAMVFLICGSRAGAALLILFLVPHEGSSFSLARLAMFGILIVFFILWIYFFARPPKFLDFLIRPSFALISALLALTLGWLLFFLRFLDPERYLPYYQRLSPLLFYLLVLALQSSVFVLISRYGFHRDNLPQFKSIYKSSLMAFCVLLFALCFIATTHLGFTKDPAYWGNPAFHCLDGKWSLRFSWARQC